MEKIMSYANLNYDEFMRQLNVFNPLSKHAKEEVEKEVSFTKAAMADVKNQVAQNNLGPNPERSAIFNKIETIFGQMSVHPRPPTYWDRTKEEALSYHLHNSHSTAETLRSLVRDLWKTVKDDKVDKDLQEYRQKKLQYLTKRDGEVNVGERKKFDTVDDLRERVQDSGIDKSHVTRTEDTRGQVRAEDAGSLRKEERGPNFQTQDAGGFRKEERSPTFPTQDPGKTFEGGRTQDAGGFRKEERPTFQTQETGKTFEGRTQDTGFRKEERSPTFQTQDTGKKFEGGRTQDFSKDVRGEERNYEGGRMQGSADRIGANYLGSEFSAGDNKKDHGDYQFHKMKQNEGFQKEGYTHPPAGSEFQRDYGYYNNPDNWTYYPKPQPGHQYYPTDNLQNQERQRSGTNMGGGV